MLTNATATPTAQRAQSRDPQDPRLRVLASFPHGLPLLSPVPDATSAVAYGYPSLQEALGMSAGDIVALLESLSDGGLLERRVHDRVRQCPGCEGSVLSSRATCGSCDSSDLASIDVLHHYRCGHVAPARDFEAGGSAYRCGKCHKGLKHIGVDYDRPASQAECRPCGWVGPQARTTMTCLSCTKTFAPEEAATRAVFAYEITGAGRLALVRGKIETDAGPASLSQGPGIYHFPIWMRDLARHLSISTRQERPLTVAMVRAVGEGPAASVTDEIAAVAARMARASDVVSVREDGAVLVLLPDTDGTGADRFIRRTRTLLSERSEPISIAVGVETSDGTTVTADRMLARAALRLTGEAVSSHGARN